LDKRDDVDATCEMSFSARRILGLMPASCGRPLRADKDKFMIKSTASVPTSSLEIRRLDSSDVATYRELRLEGLK